MIITFLYIVSTFMQYFHVKRGEEYIKTHKSNKVIREFQIGKYCSSLFRIPKEER